MSEVNEYVGKYYSIQWVRDKVLKQSEGERKDVDAQLAQEKKDGLYDDDEDDDNF